MCKVRLTNASGVALLRPGQVAIAAPLKAGITVKDVDTEVLLPGSTAISCSSMSRWESAMRKISRWYDVEVVYPEGKINEIYVCSEYSFSQSRYYLQYSFLA